MRLGPLSQRPVILAFALGDGQIVDAGDAHGNWFRSYGNENWEFDGNGLMRKRYASINDVAIKENERHL